MTYLLPVTALAWGALLLGERVQGRMLLALGMILAGITLAGGWLERRRTGGRGKATVSRPLPPAGGPGRGRPGP